MKKKYIYIYKHGVCVYEEWVFYLWECLSQPQPLVTKSAIDGSTEVAIFWPRHPSHTSVGSPSEGQLAWRMSDEWFEEWMG